MGGGMALRPIPPFGTFCLGFNKKSIFFSIFAPPLSLPSVSVRSCRGPWYLNHDRMFMMIICLRNSSNFFSQLCGFFNTKLLIVSFKSRKKMALSCCIFVGFTKLLFNYKDCLIQTSLFFDSL